LKITEVALGIWNCQLLSIFNDLFKPIAASPRWDY
jgi:hypothetical protein